MAVAVAGLGAAASEEWEVAAAVALKAAGDLELEVAEVVVLMTAVDLVSLMVEDEESLPTVTFAGGGLPWLPASDEC